MPRGVKRKAEQDHLASLAATYGAKISKVDDWPDCAGTFWKHHSGAGSDSLQCKCGHKWKSGEGLGEFHYKKHCVTCSKWQPWINVRQEQTMVAFFGRKVAAGHDSEAGESTSLVPASAGADSAPAVPPSSSSPRALSGVSSDAVSVSGKLFVCCICWHIVRPPDCFFVQICLLHFLFSVAESRRCAGFCIRHLFKEPFAVNFPFGQFDGEGKRKGLSFYVDTRGFAFHKGCKQVVEVGDSCSSCCSINFDTSLKSMATRMQDPGIVASHVSDAYCSLGIMADRRNSYR